MAIGCRVFGNACGGGRLASERVRWREWRSGGAWWRCSALGGAWLGIWFFDPPGFRSGGKRLGVIPLSFNIYTRPHSPASPFFLIFYFPNQCSTRRFVFLWKPPTPIGVLESEGESEGESERLSFVNNTLLVVLCFWLILR